MAINGGLFEYASNAGAETNAAIANEQELANLEADMTVDELIDKYTSGDGETGGGITAATIQSDLATYLGKPLNYGIEYDDKSANGYGEKKWEIFYADEDHIYIITKGHLDQDGLKVTDKDGVSYNGTSDFTADNLQNKYPAVAQGLFDKTYDPTSSVGSELKYTSTTNNNMKATQYLLDSGNWSSYVNKYADWAIGGPTLELFVKSYNAYYPANTVELETPTGNGYANPLSDANSVPRDTYLNHFAIPDNISPEHYWLACPSSASSIDVMSVRAILNQNSVQGSLGQRISYSVCIQTCSMFEV